MARAIVEVNLVIQSPAMGADLAAENIRFHCPACGRALSAPPGSVGKRAVCPHCKISLTIPQGLNHQILCDEEPPSIATATATCAEGPAWREIVRDVRELVPLIECAAGVGSGLLVSRDGLVVTNRHVVERSQLFMLRFYDGSKAKAVLVHTHGSRDLAVLRAAIRRERCFDIEHNVADSVEAGDDVLAIGQPRGFAFTSTRGIISEPHRRLADGEYVQTDVAINPGNSGGPLLDRFGKLVALNTQIQRDSEGLGFAIGGKEVQAYVLFVLDQLRRHEIHLPSDEEIAAAEHSLSPWDIAVAAVNASALHNHPSQTGHGQPCLNVQTPGGLPFTVYVGGNLFVVGGCVASHLSDKQLRDPDLLLQLLKWQNELCGPNFEISGDGLFLGFRRSVQGLDVNEAREAILRVSDALEALSEPLRRHLGR